MAELWLGGTGSERRAWRAVPSSHFPSHPSSPTREVLLDAWDAARRCAELVCPCGNPHGMILEHLHVPGARGTTCALVCANEGVSALSQGAGGANFPYPELEIKACLQESCSFMLFYVGASPHPFPISSQLLVPLCHGGSGTSGALPLVLGPSPFQEPDFSTSGIPSASPARRSC